MQLLGLRTAAMKSRQMSAVSDDVRPLRFTAEERNCTIAMEKVEPFYDSAPAVYLQYCTFTYSTDEREWKPFIPGETVIELGYREEALICARAYNYSFSNSNVSYNRFKISGEVSVSGDVMSLITSEEPLDTIPSVGCFRRLFENCSTLIEIPTLSATQLKPSCYREMFKGCSGFETAPELPAKVLQESCYYGMFKECSKLFEAPDLSHVAVLNSECCRQMFMGCSSMIYARMPSSDNIKLATACFKEMFENCTSLVSTSVLTAFTLVEDCYTRLFYNCSSLSYIATNQVGFDGCTQWTYGVAEQGCFRYLKDLNPEVVWGENGIPLSWKNCDFEEDVSSYGLEVSGTGLFAIQKSSILDDDQYFEISYDFGHTWEKYNGEYKYAYMPVCFKGNVRTLNGSRFVTKSGAVSLSGSVSSLLGSVTDDNRTYAGFFAHSDILNIPSLPEPTIPYQYNGTFAFCNRIERWAGFTFAEAIPEGACNSMFAHCESLSKVDRFYANNIGPYGCQSMFFGCRRLEEIRCHERGCITAYKFACDGMFKNCSNLSKFVCEQMRLEGMSCCQSMFEGCSSLQQAFIAIYGWQDYACSHMYKGCTEIITAPCLEGKYEGEDKNVHIPRSMQYAGMFDGCSSLNTIFYRWKDWNGTDGWVKGVWRTGVLYALKELWEPDNPDPMKTYEISRGDSFCPENFINRPYIGVAYVPPSNPDDGGLPWGPGSGYGLNFFAVDDSALRIERHGDDFNILEPINLQYSLDDGYTWTGFPVGVEIPVARGDTLILRSRAFDDLTFAINRFGADENNYYSFVITGQIEVSGCVDCLTFTPVQDVKLEGGSFAVAQKAPLIDSYWYYRLFANCVGLTSAGFIARLEYTENATHCYASMYEGCVNLRTGGGIFSYNNYELRNSACKNMFKNCRSLTQGFAPDKCSAMGDYCFESMYEGCSALCRIVGEFPAIISEGCYKAMFKDTALSEAPELPAKFLKPYCYMEMFGNCQNLVKVPEILPAEEVPRFAYSAMFARCKSLEKSPVLRGIVIREGGYQEMFAMCSKLAKVITHQVTLPSNNISDFWLYDVAKNGVFVCSSQLEISTQNSSTCPQGWEIQYLSIEDTAWQLCFTATQNATVAMEAVGDAPEVNLETSFDGETWVPFVVGETTIELQNSGDKVYFRARQYLEKPLGKSENDYNRFVMTGTIRASGNVQSLLLRTHGIEAAPAYCYSHLFDGCESLLTPPNLPAMELSEGCYTHMFENCIRLYHLPDLPSTKLADYCYSYMFKGAFSVMATDIKNTVISLNAEKLAKYCYSHMFEGCLLVRHVEKLPARDMVEGCYSYMFDGCNNLWIIETKQNSFDYCENWVRGISASGKFLCPFILGDEKTIQRGPSACPDGWRVGTPSW